ncbi:MAG TPA: FHA domain-containing protein [Acidobacteriota bacterium]|nr:FHA domain-containing protein [Acidobacteriota bacterium]
MADSSAYLKALTPEARNSLGGAYLQITTFPFRAGRESRLMNRAAAPPDARRRPESSPNNDLYLLEVGNVFNVSREHFLIDYRDGAYVIVDRGSSCGTLVEGDLVGEKRAGGWRRLENNDVIIVGTSESKFVFKFVIMQNS